MRLTPALLAFAALSLACGPVDAGAACEAAPCGSNGRCVVEAGQARCECNAGWAPQGLSCAKVPNDAPERATALTSTDTPRDFFMSGQQAAYFRFDAKADNIYRLALGLERTRALHVRFINETLGTTSVDLDAGAPGWERTFRALSTGPYLLELSPTAGTQPQAFTLQLQDFGPDDASGTSDQPTPLAVGAGRDWRIDNPSDWDVFSFTPQPGRAYRVWCELLTRGTPATPYLDVEWDSSVPERHESFCGPADVIGELEATDATPLVFWVHGSHGSTYHLRVEDRGVDDHGDTAASATALTFGVATAGRFEVAGDRDVFTFPVQAGRLYRIRMPRTSGDALYEPWLADGDGVLWFGSNYAFEGVPHWINSRTSGPARVELLSTSGVGDYAVTVDDLGPDDHADAPQDATPLAVGTVTSGRLDFNDDLDCFGLKLGGGNAYTVDLVSDCQLQAQILDSALDMVWVGSGSGGSFTPASSGSYVVRISQWEQRLCNYTLVVR